MNQRPVSAINGYHVHVYFDAPSRERAMALREALAREFPNAELGRNHELPVGPHPEWSYQVKFSPDLFARIVPWLALNRDGLTVLVHPNTGDDLADHRDFAFWMGSMPALDLDALG